MTASSCGGGVTWARPAKPRGSNQEGATRAVAVVHRAGRRVLAGDRVAREETPEAAVLGGPGRRLVDHVRRPLVLLAGADRDAVAAGEVDERDPQRPPRVVALAEADPPEAVERLGEALDPPRRRDRHLGLVLARPEVRRVRAGAGVDDRVPVHELEVDAVVPAAPKVGAVEVVRRVGDPGRDELLLVLVEVDRDHLPVGLVVVHAVEARAPGVVGEEEPVLADRPAALADDPALVDEAPVALPDLVVLERGGGGGRPRDGAAKEQREREQPVAEARQQAAAGEPAERRP